MIIFNRDYQVDIQTINSVFKICIYIIGNSSIYFRLSYTAYPDRFIIHKRLCMLESWE